VRLPIDDGQVARPAGPEVVARGDGHRDVEPGRERLGNSARVPVETDWEQGLVPARGLVIVVGVREDDGHAVPLVREGRHGRPALPDP